MKKPRQLRLYPLSCSAYALRIEPLDRVLPLDGASLASTILQCYLERLLGWSGYIVNKIANCIAGKEPGSAAGLPIYHKGCHGKRRAIKG